MKVVTSDLAAGTHFESSTGMSDNDEGMAAAVPRKRKPTKRKRTSKDNKDDIFRMMAESTAKSANASEAKSEAISYSAMSISRDNAQRSLEAAKVKKKAAIKNLKHHSFTDGDNSRARKLVKTVKKKIAPSPAKSDSSEPMIYSQSTTASIRNVGSYDTVFGHAEDIIDADKQIKEYTEELNHITTKMGSFRQT